MNKYITYYFSATRKQILDAVILMALFVPVNTFAQTAKTDTKFCNNLSKIITSAQNTSFGDLKRDHLGAGQFKSSAFVISNNSKIYFSENAKSNVYEEVISTFADSVQTLEQKNNALEMQVQKVISCLPKQDWTVFKEADAQGTYYDIKNLTARVFITLIQQNNNIVLKIMRPELTLAKCVSGDCVNGFGKIQYENGDIYEGQFLNSQRIGVGKYIWAADQTRYEGSWLADSMSGFGAYFNAKGELEKDGYLMLGKMMKLDTSRKNFCQYGNCKNGYGVYYYNDGQLYIGNFKNNLQNGLGLFESKDGVYYGEFTNGKYNGTGIVFTPQGAVFRSNFENGVQLGEVKHSTDGKSVVEGNISDSVITGAEYTPEGILQKIGTWENDVFVPSAKKEDKYSIEFAQSLAKLYSFRDGKFGRLRGNMRKSKRVVYYDAIFKLKDVAATFVREELEKEPYVRSNLNLQPVPKKEAIEKYEWAVRNIRRSLSKTWRSDPGKNRDTDEAANRNYIFINTQNTDSYIEVKVEENVVFIDIH